MTSGVLLDSWTQKKQASTYSLKGSTDHLASMTGLLTGVLGWLRHILIGPNAPLLEVLNPSSDLVDCNLRVWYTSD